MTETTANVDRWSSPGFLADASTWVREEAARAGIALTGATEQPHVRPWSSAIRFATRDGADLWFKVNAPQTRHEGALVGLLADLEPGLVAGVVAVDLERGWSLTRDVGPVMRLTALPEQLWDPWAGVLARYAEAQVRLAGHPSEVHVTGLPEVSPSTQPEQLRELVAELGGLAPEEGGLTGPERERLEATYPLLDSWCAELADAGVPTTVQHDDLHSSNVCWAGGPIGTARIIDWGDAVWGLPFETLLGTVNSIAWHARCERDDPRILRLRDAYLEPFTQLADRRDLVRYVALARRTGCVTKALSYRRSLAGEPVATHRVEDFPVRGWLLELLEG